MVKSVKAIFSEVKKLLKFKTLTLASGGIVDTKGPGTSDVDIVYITKDYTNLELPFKCTKDPRPDKNRMYYNFKRGGRDVSICASDDYSVLRSVKHRNIEIALQKYPHVFATAVAYKMNGEKTETAFCRAIGIPFTDVNETYDIMAGDPAKIKKLAQQRESKIKTIITASKK